MTPWEYTDLRALDPVEETSPNKDIIAIYIRGIGEDIQIRLDLLESSNFDDFDLYLAFDTGPGGKYELPLSVKSEIGWDSLMVIPAHGPIEIDDAYGGKRSNSAVLVIRDQSLGSVLVNLNLNSLRDHLAGVSISNSFKLQVFLTSPGQPIVIDWIAPARSDSAPPLPVQILFAFWDTFPAYTSATALRRWDGAHTGPNGDRHGLYNLLRTARELRIPIFLLDASEPASLSALDYAGGLKMIQEMQRDRLLTLPASLGDPNFSPFSSISGIQPFQKDSIQRIEDAFGLNVQGFSYLPQGAQIDLPEEDVVFIRQQSVELIEPGSEDSLSEIYPTLYPQRWQEKLVFPLSETTQTTNPKNFNPAQASQDGLSMEWKRILIDSALLAAKDPETGPLSYLNLGGDLQASTWGEPQSARATFRWLRDHPWVKVLESENLVAMRSGAKKPFIPPPINESKKAPFPSPDELVNALEKAPRNVLGLAAIQAYQALFSPIYPFPPELPALRAEYIGQVWSLLEAAKWAEMPVSNVECNQDLDRDDEPECRLTSNRVYAQFEIDDGSLTYLFVLAPNDVGEANKFNQDCNLQARWGINSSLEALDVTTRACQRSIHQFIGPSSQFITGLSDPGQWKLGEGLLSDPAVISGAFSGPGLGYRADVMKESLIFNQEDGKIRKYYSIGDIGISADFQFSKNETYPFMKIPLALDPWNRFSLDWADRYTSSWSPKQLTWSLQDEISMSVLTSTSLQFSDFRASRGLFTSPEDPNQDYGPGHYIPFPLGLVEIEAEKSIKITIELVPTP
jgi:hypothetical protein